MSAAASLSERPAGAAAAAAGRVGARVEEVSAAGVRAYLIREPALPFLSCSFHFANAGSSTDPDARTGLANVASGLLDEGAGPYDSQAFHRELEDRAIRLDFDADRDSLTGSLKTLSAQRDQAFELLRLALTEPRFDEEPVARVRGQVLADIRRRESDPDFVAQRGWFTTAFPGHAYARPTRGTPESLEALTAEDARGFTAARLARSNLVLGVAGDITAEELRSRLEQVFSALPEHPEPLDVPTAVPTHGRTTVSRLPIPQSVVAFGTAGVHRRDPDHYPAYVANYVLGGGGFSSRLLQEIREKRGLAYSAYSYLLDLESSPLWIGGVSTNNGQVAESIRLIRQEMARMAAGEVSDEDLANAKTYLTGSFALRLTSNDQVARALVGMLAHDLGADFLERRNGLIEAVTLDDVKRASARVFGTDPLVSIAGAPEGVEG